MNHDPELLESLKQIFPTRADLRVIVEHQQRLWTSIRDLDTSHRTVQEHIRNFTDLHGKAGRDAAMIENALRALDTSHRETRGEIQRAIQELNTIQQEIRKISDIEIRVRELERKSEDFKQDDRRDDRKVEELESRLRKLESRR